jgi:hypothetical protein
MILLEQGSCSERLWVCWFGSLPETDNVNYLEI